MMLSCDASNLALLAGGSYAAGMITLLLGLIALHVWAEKYKPQFGGDHASK